MHELFDGTATGIDFKGWRGVNANGADTVHAWHCCGDVKLSDVRPDRFDITPGQGLLVNGQEGNTANLATDALFGDCDLQIDFVVPAGSNSGIYFLGRYEIQVLDSWGADALRFSTCAGVYARWIDETAVGGAAPRINASRPPGEWQTFDIRFRAPRFDAGGQKIRNACFERVVWNGEVVHENVEVEGPTRAAMAADERPQGPLMLQGDHGPVAYRKIQLTPLSR